MSTSLTSDQQPCFQESWCDGCGSEVKKHGSTSDREGIWNQLATLPNNG